MDDANKIEIDYRGTTLPIKNIVSGIFIEKRYIKCPHMNKKCGWRLSQEHRKGYEYLNNSCYLSGSFKLECPD